MALRCCNGLNYLCPVEFLVPRVVGFEGGHQILIMCRGGALGQPQAPQSPPQKQFTHLLWCLPSPPATAACQWLPTSGALAMQQFKLLISGVLLMQPEPAEVGTEGSSCLRVERLQEQREVALIPGRGQITDNRAG